MALGQYGPGDMAEERSRACHDHDALLQAGVVDQESPNQAPHEPDHDEDEREVEHVQQRCKGEELRMAWRVPG